MHITEKILTNIKYQLSDKYRVYVDEKDWKLFKEPLAYKDSILDIAKFEIRQNKSLDIIKTILDIHGKSEIVKYLGRLASLEPKIQQVQPWVRDHVVHAINTFLLGVYILENIEFPPSKNTSYDYPFMWKLCGPTHDLGYPLEIAANINAPFVKEFNDFIDELKSSSPKMEMESYPKNLNKLCDDIDSNKLIQDRLTEWALGIDVEEYYNWLKNKNKTDHGVISALSQLKVIDVIYNKVNPRKEYRDIKNEIDLNFNQRNFDQDIVNSSAALFIHNIDLNYYGFSNKINFDLSPLGFLLFLCDTFQEWDRYSEKRNVFSGEDFDINCSTKSISLFVPQEIEAKIFAALYQRLSGLVVRVNGRIAVS